MATRGMIHHSAYPERYQENMAARYDYRLLRRARVVPAGPRGTVREKRVEGAAMEFGILFTSHPNHVTEPYPHRDVHARVTAEIEAADRLGYDTAWVAEHHFSNQYGIMPDVFTYMGYLAARTSRVRLGTAVVTLPLFEPVRYV